MVNPAIAGSTTDGHVGTDEGSPWNTLTPRCNETNPLPKPSYRHNSKEFQELMMESMQSTISNADQHSNAEILESLKKAAKAMSRNWQTDYWVTDEGQSKLLRIIDLRAQKPCTGLNMFDYTNETKAMLSSAGTAEMIG